MKKIKYLPRYKCINPEKECCICHSKFDQCYCAVKLPCFHFCHYVCLFRSGINETQCDVCGSYVKDTISEYEPFFTASQNEEEIKEKERKIKESDNQEPISNIEMIHQNEEILNQNEEILNQNEEILNQNEEILNQNEEILNQNEEILNQNEEISKEGKEYDDDKDFELIKIVYEEVFKEEEEEFFENEIEEEEEEKAEKEFSHMITIKNIIRPLSEYCPLEQIKFEEEEEEGFENESEQNKNSEYNSPLEKEEGNPLNVEKDISLEVEANSDNKHSSSLSFMESLNKKSTAQTGDETVFHKPEHLSIREIAKKNDEILNQIHILENQINNISKELEEQK